MEIAVIHNMGRDAARAAMARVAPDEVDYPVHSRYHAPRSECATLNPSMQRVWLQGYDSWAR